MKYQIKDDRGNIVDKDLSYEEALMWIDGCSGKYYIMENMEGENYGRSKTRRHVVSDS